MIVPVERGDDDRLAEYRLLHGGAALRVRPTDDFFVAEGWTAMAQLIASGHELRSVVLLPERVDRLRRDFPDVASGPTPVYSVERSVLADSVGFDLHRGVLAAGTRRAPATVRGLASTARRLAILEGLNDAENVGLISRAARALGIDGMVIDPTCTDPYSRRSVRVSLGEILHLPIARPGPREWPEVLADLATAGFETWALTPHESADDIWQLDVPDRVALVLGAEGPGLRDRTLAAASRRVRIPIRDDVDSLNVSHAAAIAFAALARGVDG